MTELHRSKSFVWTLFLIFTLCWFYALGVRTLVPTDEGRYAEMAREMFMTGDWITTRLNGIKYFEKPPLQTWMNALTFASFGLGEWQARLWTGLCGWFGVIAVAVTGTRMFNARVGFVAALILGSSLLWIALGHINSLDMGLAAMMTIALCGLLLGQRNDADIGEKRGWMWLCWAGMALAVMSKGLIGVVLPGAVLVLYTLFSRDWSIWKRLYPIGGLLVFFAITTPWFVLVSLKNPEFPHFFFIHEHWQRFTSPVHHREGPWYYFIPILALGILPWLGMLLQSLWGTPGEERRGFQPRKMLLVWAVFIFFFFSISSSKLPSYILPIFPALALLMACYLERASNLAIMISAGLLALISGIGLFFVPKIATMTKVPFELPLYAAYMPWVEAAAICALVGSVLAMWLANRHKQWALVVLASTGFFSTQILMLGHEPLGRHAAGIMHVPAVLAELTPDIPIYSVGRYEQALPFYLQRTTILVEHADEMAFGLTQEPHLWIPELATFITTWNADHVAGKKSIAIIRPAIFKELQAQGLPMRILGEDPRRVIVTNAVN
jgi:4-amino-4-deoxy-L-arabinose transferase-like glycosyltransferase